MSNSSNSSVGNSPPRQDDNKSTAPGGVDNDNSPPGDNTSPPEDSNSSPGEEKSPPSVSPPSPSGNSSKTPPSGGNDSSPPGESDPPPSPPKGSSLSPPPSSKSNSPPPSPPSYSDSDFSPPPDSSENPSPPSYSESDPSPPPPPPKSKSPPPPSQEHFLSPPPSPNKSSSPPSSSHPPPTSGRSHTPPPPPPVESITAPISSSNTPPPPPPDGSSTSSTPPQLMDPPPSLSEFPPFTPPSPELPWGSLLAPTRHNPIPSNDDTPSSQAKNRSPKLNSPPPSNSDQLSGSSSQHTGAIIGATVAAVVLIFMFTIFLVMSNRRRRRSHSYAPYYGHPPDVITMTTDGYYYGPQHTIGVPGHSQEYYNESGSQIPPPLNFTGNSYANNTGNMFVNNTTGSMLSPGGAGADMNGLGSSQSCFSYEELMAITNGFSKENILGEGGFGCVHKGWLPDGRIVAVKQLKVGSGQGEREFRAEVEIISRVHHRHLVSLVGYCIAEHHRLLVYEYVPNRTLEYHLHENGLPVMDWSKRLKIAIGAARGLAYLHEDCHPKIIHRDIKSANILVDDVFEAQVADFGLAKLTTDTYTHVSTRVMGTFGYMAPEYASSGKLTDRSDVFSFGVVLLEIVTGRKPVDTTQPLGDESLVEWARPLLVNAVETGDISELIDPRLENRFVETEMIRMIGAAAACVRHSAPKRPRMAQVLRALDSDGDMPNLSNGVKYGQSTIIESRQYNSDIQKFRMMAFGSDDGSGYGMSSGECTSRELPNGSQGLRRENGLQEFTSGESETRPINPRGSLKL